MAVFNLTLVLTHACDLACEYCSAGLKDGRRLDPALGRRAIDRAILGLVPGDELALGFFGGEPLLEWEAAKELIAYARGRGVPLRPHLTTNGSRVDARVARELAERDVDVAVSADGLPEVHDRERRTAGGLPTASRALAALAALEEAGARARVVSVVRPSNVRELAAGMRFLADRGVRALHPSLDYAAAWRREDVPPLEEAVRELGQLYVERFPALSISWLETKLALLAGFIERKVECGFGRGEVAVAPSGRLYPCERLVEDDRSGAHAMGHVLDSDGPFGPHGATCVPGESSGCSPCEARFACANACACQNLARTGRPDEPDGLVCVLEQACIAAARDALAALAARQGVNA